MSEDLKILVVDDERPAREYLKDLLSEIDGINVVGEAVNGTDALFAIDDLLPDLVFLDLQMPERSGIDVVRSLSDDHAPMIAFVTAFDEYAIQAFELNAVDYLLKPVEKERLIKTIDRAKGRLATSRSEIDLNNVRSAVEIYDESISSEPIKRIPVRHRDAIILIPIEDVVSITADGELLHITTVEKLKYNINFRLKDLESRLEPSLFVRLSRGTIVNLNMIDHVYPQPGGTYLVILKDNQEFNVSRSQSKYFRERFLKM